MTKKHLTGYTTYKGKLPRRNAKGEYSSIRPVIFFILIALVILFLTLNALFNAPLRSPCPSKGCFVSSVPKAQAFEPLPQNKALWETIKNDPIRKEIYMTFGQTNTEVAIQALAIAQCESGMRPTAKNRNTNGTEDYGVFQINTVHQKRFGTLYKTDPSENIHVAYEIYKKQGFHPWVCARILGII